MSFLCGNLAAIVVAASVSVVAWIYGGMMGPLLEPVVPWLFVLMVETLVCFPQRHRGETPSDARARLWYAMKRDKLLWLVICFLAVMTVPLVNCGLCPFCDAVKIARGADPAPAIPFLPLCVNRTDHYHVLLWFMLALPAMLIVRHSLLAGGKRMVCALLVWNGLVLAAYGFVQSALDAPGPLWNSHNNSYWGGTAEFFSTFGYSNTAGDFFTLFFGIAVALWRDHYERFRNNFIAKDISRSAPKRPRQFWKKHFYLIPAGIFFFAAINTLSRSAIICATSTAFIYFLHTLLVTLKRMNRLSRVKTGMFSSIAFVLVVFFALTCMPEKVRHEVDSIGSYELLNRVSGKNQYHARVAYDIWKDHKLFGCGGWGYAHFCLQKMDTKERQSVQRDGGINVHNDYLQFLAEHGLVGFASLVAMVVMLIWPIASQWRKLAKELRFSKTKPKIPRPEGLFVLPASVFFILIAVSATFFHAFGDCPLRSPALLSLFLVSLAAMPGFMSQNH